MGDFFLPGKHGIGTRGYTPVDSEYNRAADDLIELFNEGRTLNTSDAGIRQVLERFGASSISELKIKRRGW